MEWLGTTLLAIWSACMAWTIGVIAWGLRPRRERKESPIMADAELAVRVGRCKGCNKPIMQTKRYRREWLHQDDGSAFCDLSTAEPQGVVQK